MVKCVNLEMHRHKFGWVVGYRDIKIWLFIESTHKLAVIRYAFCAVVRNF